MGQRHRKRNVDAASFICHSFRLRFWVWLRLARARSKWNSHARRGLQPPPPTPPPPISTPDPPVRSQCLRAGLKPLSAPRISSWSAPMWRVRSRGAAMPPASPTEVLAAGATPPPLPPSSPPLFLCMEGPYPGKSLWSETSPRIESFDFNNAAEACAAQADCAGITLQEWKPLYTGRRQTTLRNAVSHTSWVIRRDSGGAPCSAPPAAPPGPPAAPHAVTLELWSALTPTWTCDDPPCLADFEKASFGTAETVMLRNSIDLYLESTSTSRWSGRFRAPRLGTATWSSTPGAAAVQSCTLTAPRWQRQVPVTRLPACARSR